MRTLASSRKWKTVQIVEFEWYWRYNDESTYTIDLALPQSANPDRVILDITGNGGYNHNYGGYVNGDVQILNADTVRVQYKAPLAQNPGGVSGPWGPIQIIAYESLRPFRSSQIITGNGPSLSLVQKIDWRKAWFARNFFLWHAAQQIGAHVRPLDSEHIAQDAHPDFGYSGSDYIFFRTHIVEF